MLPTLLLRRPRQLACMRVCEPTCLCACEFSICLCMLFVCVCVCVCVCTCVRMCLHSTLKLAQQPTLPSSALQLRPTEGGEACPGIPAIWPIRSASRAAYKIGKALVLPTGLFWIHHQKGQGHLFIFLLCDELNTKKHVSVQLRQKSPTTDQATVSPKPRCKL